MRCARAGSPPGCSSWSAARRSRSCSSPRPGFKSGRTLIVDAVLIALAANLGNLLDRAPGRTIKFGLSPTCPIAIVIGTAPIGIAIAPVMGAAFGLLGDDLHERLMLGDTGANVIGAVLGLGGGARLAATASGSR